MGKLKIHIFLVCLIFCFSFLGVGFSDTVTLKSGQKVEGRIIEKTDQYVKLEFQGVQLVYYNDEIASIDQASSSSGNTVTESLYKAYISSLNAPGQPKKEKAEELLPSAKPEPNETTQASPASQVTPALTSTPDLSQLPPEYQKLIKTTLANLQASKPSPADSQVTPALTSTPDLSQLPPEYQKLIKTTLANLQASKSKPVEEKK